MNIKSLIPVLIISALVATGVVLTYKNTLFFQTWFIRLAPIPDATPSGLSLDEVNRLSSISLYYNPLNNNERTLIQLQKLERGWQWQNNEVIDRADNQLVAKVLASFYHIEILDSFALNALQSENVQASKADILNLYGINAQSIEFQLDLPNTHILQQFILGAEAPWIGERKTTEAMITFYIWSPIKEKIYLMRSQNLDFLKQGPTVLRDKSPFFFKTDELAKIEFSSPKENWKIERNQTMWQATKPYICDIDPIAIDKLITDISKLKVTHFFSSLANTNYASLAKNDFYTLTLAYNLSLKPNLETLTLTPVKDQNNNTAYWIAKHSQRPGYFQMKSIGSTDEPGILNLSLNLANLRSKLLTQMPVTSIQNIGMVYPDGFTQILSQPQPDNWQLTLPGSQAGIIREKPHENKIEPFLKALLETPALSILSEQEDPSLDNYGLTQASLTLQIKTQEKAYTLNISKIIQASSSDDAEPASTTYYAKWDHLNTIFKISEEAYYHLVVPTYQWRSSKIWDFSPLAVKGLIRKKQNNNAIVLGYEAFENTWTAQVNNQNLSIHLIQDEANQLLTNLNNLSSFSWLPKDHQGAQQALQTPSIAFDIILKDEENPEREQFLTLWLAPTQPDQYYFFYGKVIGQGKPSFIIKGETVTNLIKPLFENSFNKQELQEMLTD